MWVDVKINADLFFKGCLKFLLQMVNKFCYPTIVLIVFLAVADEDLPAGRQVS
jgi:hypothetical protein